MKNLKIIKLLSCLIIVLGFSYFSQAQDRVHVWLQSVSHDIGDTLNYPVYITPNGHNLGTYQATLLYDPTAISYIAFDNDRQWSTFVNPAEPGKLVLGAFTTSGQIDNFYPITLQFKTIGFPGQESDMKIVIDFIANGSNDELSFSFTNGHISINCQEDVFIGHADSQLELSHGKFRASNELSSDALINTTSSSVQFIGEQAVTLLPQFEVLENSIFLAYIRPCE